MQTIKYALVFGAGVASGVAGSYVYFKKKFNDIAEMEIASVKAVYAEATADTDISGDADTEEEPEKATSGRYPWGPERPEKAIEELGEERVNHVLNNYHTISSSGYSERTIMNEQRKQELAEAEFPRDDTPSEVMHITGDQFVNEERYFDKKTLFYYYDDTLADDVGNILDYSVVGVDNLVEFAEGEDSVSYFRDYNSSSDYEVVREDCSYNEALGISYEY